MDNHYHLLLETPSGNLSKILAHINGAYTSYFNNKRERCGHLFQGRYKAILIEADGYAIELSRYIHLNPVRAKLSPMPEDYKWSSYSAYIGKEKAPDWLQVNFILGYFGNTLSAARKDYRCYVDKLTGQKYDSPLKGAINSTILGSEEFIGMIKGRYLAGKSDDKDLPGLKAFMPKPTMEDIEKHVDHATEDKKMFSRNVKIYLSQKHTGKNLDDIGRHFNIGGSAVCQAARRILEKIERDDVLKNALAEIEGNLKRIGS